MPEKLPHSTSAHLLLGWVDSLAVPCERGGEAPVASLVELTGVGVTGDAEIRVGVGDVAVAASAGVLSAVTLGTPVGTSPTGDPLDGCRPVSAVTGVELAGTATDACVDDPHPAVATHPAATTAVRCRRELRQYLRFTRGRLSSVK